ncbi:hypothetical protein VTN00DRAFT_552 [Thermoascus crustaceus]
MASTNRLIGTLQKNSVMGDSGFV